MLCARLFDVDVRRQPHIGLQIKTPAVEVEVIRVIGMSGIGPVEADNIEVAVFHPDSAGKQPFRRFLSRLDVYNDAARFAKKLAPYKTEMVIVLLEVRIKYHHLREALRQKPGRQGGREGIHNVAQKSFVVLLEYGISRTIIQVNPPQEVLVVYRLDVTIAVFMKILDVGFSQRVHALHGLDKLVFALYHPVDGLVEGERSWYLVFGRNTCHRGHKQQEDDCSETTHSAPHEISSKMMWTRAIESMGWPSCKAGLNLICSAAFTACSSSPYPNPCSTRITWTCPLDLNNTSRRTSPLIFCFRPSSV